MNPYPLALLNHFTVPFKRSISTDFPFLRTSRYRGKDVPAVHIEMHFRALGIGCEHVKTLKGSDAKQTTKSRVRATNPTIFWLGKSSRSLRLGRSDVVRAA